MKNIEQIINMLYQNMISVILQGFDPKDYENVKKQYYVMLMSKYLDLDWGMNDANKFYEKMYKLEYIKWSGMPLNMKKNIFISDDNLNKIINLAGLGYKYAKNRLDKNQLISKKEALNSVKQLKEFRKNVFEYNDKLADWCVSEGTLDFYYACGINDVVSLRIGHIK